MGAQRRGLIYCREQAPKAVDPVVDEQKIAMVEKVNI